MTTTVVVNAHAGWPVEITHQEKSEDEWTTVREETVAPLREVVISVWQGKRVIVEELNKE